ncbi:MAG: PilZ domain-containing protein [Nitrospirae bacterium]|nr:PilZ domain-containing protein [Nitrospirota bacterium]
MLFKGSESFFCYSRDISSSGILIETDKVLEKGTIISCSFFLPNSERIVTDAEIMRAVPLGNKTFQYGARFTKIDAPARSAIDTFVSNATGKK